jgi:hypothetical protein
MRVSEAECWFYIDRVDGGDVYLFDCHGDVYDIGVYDYFCKQKSAITFISYRQPQLRS